MHVILTIFISLSIIGSCEPKKDKNRIDWSETTELSWKDFKKTPQYKSPHAAMSEIGFFTNFHSLKGGYDLEIIAEFDKGGSWVKPKSKTTYILQHEQFHFHIAELYARKMREAAEKNELVEKDLEERFKVIYDEYYKEYVAEQTAYDDQTKHSVDKKEQAKWEKKILEGLDSLQEYKSTIVHIPYRRSGN